MAVYYKFKSAKDFDSVHIDGHFISVANLKEKIFEKKQLGRGTDFDLMVSNAQTNEEYPDEDTLIPKNTSVLVRRVPGRPRMPIVTEQEVATTLEGNTEDSQPAKSSFSGANASAMTFSENTEWDEFGNDLYAIPEVLPVQSINQVQDAPPPSRADEDSKIKALIDTPSLDWQVQDGFGAGRGFGRGMGGRMMGGRGFGRGGILERKTPPPGYICHRCKVPGHFIQHCPTNGDPNYDVKRTKPPTGIPKSMLVLTPDGSYALPSGAAAVLKPNEAAFEKEIEGLPSTRSVTDIPPELRCPLCKEVMQDAVLTSKCCFKSFCDKCIRNHIISKLACTCGAGNVLADDLLPNKTVRETINRFLESNNSSAENVGGMLQIQDMESARPAHYKIPSPTLSASSKGEHMTTEPVQPKDPAPTLSASSKGEKLLPTQKGRTLEMKETVNEAKDIGVPPLLLGTEKPAKIVDASEATFESMTMKEPLSQASARQAGEEEQQNPSASELGKKKKKKKARVPPNDLQWRAPQDIGADNYMTPFPQSCDPYWGNMQFGMDGFMNPYNGTMPYMGYVPGPFDVPMGGMPPQDPFGGQGYMMPVIPPHREYSDFSMGVNAPPSMMSRAEFEARKADLRRKRGVEGHVERDGSKDHDLSRSFSSNGNIAPTKSKHRIMPQTGTPEHQYRHNHHHHRMEKDSCLDQVRQHKVESDSSLDRARSQHHELEREFSPDRTRVQHHGLQREFSPDRARAQHHRLEREFSPDRARANHYRSHHHHDEREISPERSHHHRHHRHIESSSRDQAPIRHMKRRPESHDLPPPFSCDLEPVRKRRTADLEDVETVDIDKKQKASVFSRISFPDEKKKVLSENAGRHHHHQLNNGFKDHKAVSPGNGHRHEVVIPTSLHKSGDDHDSSDDERHFKRRSSRYEPSPPPTIEWEEDARLSRSSKEHDRHKHR